MKEALYIIGDVIHNLQRERGCTTIFLGSHGKLFSGQLQKQYENTDHALRIFNEGAQRWLKSRALKETQVKRVEKFIETHPSLSETRKQILSQKFQQFEAVDYYTHHLICPLLQTMVEIALFMDGVSPNKASAYSAFLQWKERVGLERALGTRGFVSYGFHNKEFLERILFLLSEQENYRNTFFLLADDTFRNIARETLEHEIFKKIEDLHEALKNTAASISEMTPEDWFDLMTQKVDLLHKCEKKLVDTLTSVSENKQQVAPEDNLIDDSKNNLPLIKSFPLFHGLSEHHLSQLLQYGQIREFPKGKLLFQEGEPANRLYVVIRGWVKVFKGTPSGEETILQMLSCGDSIMESAVFLNSPYPVSAQIVESATLLSLPAPMIREQLRKNNELALNLLASMSYRSQNLIRQIENARLKSADQRVGWFLLKLLLEQGRSSREVRLPYDKSMVASYLDMKRETFSRSLKRLKTKGFAIENDTIVIPALSSLCGYCDHDLAVECKLHGTPDCPNPQCDFQDENAA